MLNRYTFILLAALVVLTALLLLRTSEEEKILARFEQIRTLAEMPAPENAIEQVSKARQIAQLFSEQTFFDLTNAGYGTIEIPTRVELTQRITRGRARLSSLELALQDPQVRIEGDHAQVQVQGSALGSIRDEPDQFLEIHLIEVMLIKEEDEWLVTGARHLRDERQPSQM